VLAVAQRAGRRARRPMPPCSAMPHSAVPLPMLDISSTDIRAAWRAASASTRWCRPRWHVILNNHHLYRD
jgi:nicotinic acid mononucleotide adenylyltransferase